VFSDAEESEIEEYILAASKLYYGLTTKDVRILACQYAIKNNVTNNMLLLTGYRHSLKGKTNYQFAPHKLLVWAEQQA
jgi:hypothetical protein